MPVIQKEVSIAANATNENVLSGSAFEFLRRNSIVSAGAVGSATGMARHAEHLGQQWLHGSRRVAAVLPGAVAS